MKNINTNKKQKGFSILAVILVIVAVIVAIGVWALSGQTNTSSSGNSTSDIQAASLINDSGAIKLAFDTLVINGTSANKITFIPNVAGATNMLDPVNGIQIPKPNVNAIKVGEEAPIGIWVYNKIGFTGDDVGTGGADQAILVAGVKDIVCQRVNYILHGSTFVPTTMEAGTLYGNVRDATITNPTTEADTTLIDAKRWTTGCVSTGSGFVNGSADDNNLFFRILKAN